MTTCKRCQRGERHDFPHNKSSYRNHACRCEICVQDNRNAGREYRAKNIEKAREAGRDYYASNKEVIAQRRRGWPSVENKRQRDAEYRSKNREKLAAAQRAYRKAHAEERRLYDRAYATENADSIRQRKRVYKQGYRAENFQYINQQARQRVADLCRRGGRQRFTEKEDAIVARDDITLREIAVLLGRSYSSVANRRSRLRHG